MKCLKHLTKFTLSVIIFEGRTFPSHCAVQVSDHCYDNILAWCVWGSMCLWKVKKSFWKLKPVLGDLSVNEFSCVLCAAENAEEETVERAKQTVKVWTHGNKMLAPIRSINRMNWFDNYLSCFDFILYSFIFGFLTIWWETAKPPTVPYWTDHCEAV